MKDVVVVVPVLLVGAFGLAGMAEAPYHNRSQVTDYMLFLGFLAVVLLLWYRMKLRSAERLRALELGRDRPQAEGPRVTFWGPGAVAVAMGTVTPVGVMLIGWFAAAASPPNAPGVWASAMLMGLASIVCGTRLASRAVRPDGNAPPKPVVYDPDAFDLVARRG